MPKVVPIPDALSKPFWDAVNQKKLVVQLCEHGHQQYPPQAKCFDCGTDKFTWKEVKGRGHIAAVVTVEDTRVERFIPDQPYNLAVVKLDENPLISFYSDLPGTKPYEAKVGAPVELIFEEVAPGQLIHEWRVIK